MVALSHGLPLVLIPLGGDQAGNAQRCAALGVGRVIGPEDRTASAIHAAVREVLADRRYHESAVRIRDEIAALPGPEHAVALLEQLAVEKQPLLTG